MAASQADNLDPWVDDWNTNSTNSTFDGMSGKPDEIPEAQAPEFNKPLEDVPPKRYNGGAEVTKPYASSRPKYGPTQVQDVWNAHVDIETGAVTDPSGASIVWDRTKPRNGQWDMGHIPGQKYSDMHSKYMNGEISLDEFVEWFRNPDNYRPELPRTNRGHAYE